MAIPSCPAEQYNHPPLPQRGRRAPSGSNIEKLQRMISARRAVLMMRVVGKGTLLEGADLEVYNKILKVEGLSLADFAQVLGMTFMGTLRFVTFSPINYEVVEQGSDELNKGRMYAVIRFSLPKGCYATVLLREIMRPVNPFASGY